MACAKKSPCNKLEPRSGLCAELNQCHVSLRQKSPWLDLCPVGVREEELFTAGHAEVNYQRLYRPPPTRSGARCEPGEVNNQNKLSDSVWNIYFIHALLPP